MELTNADAQRLLMGCRSIDADEGTKLDADVRMKIAVNINRLMPNMQAFERVYGSLQAALQIVNGTPIDAKVMQEITKLSDQTDNYKLKKISLADLKLKDNPKIKADVVARLAPIIRDFDDGESDE